MFTCDLFPFPEGSPLEAGDIVHIRGNPEFHPSLTPQSCGLTREKRLVFHVKFRKSLLSALGPGHQVNAHHT